jgi:hypothetical protein
MTLKITPATREEIGMLRFRKYPARETPYGGIAKRLAEMKVGDAIWIECPPGVTMNKHQIAVASNCTSFCHHRASRFMTRRDNENNRLAVIRVE